MKYKRILTMIVLLVSVSLCLLGYIIFYYNGNRKQTQIGNYFDDALTGGVVLYENGKGRYVPKFDSTEDYYGKYAIEDDLLTIKTKSLFYEFKITEKGLLLNRYTDYSGKIYENDKEELLYKYSEKEPNVIRRVGKYKNYKNGSQISIYGYGNKATFVLDSDINNVTFEGEYSFNENMFVIEREDLKMVFEMVDGDLVLKNSNIDGKLVEYKEDEEVFIFEYYEE